MYLWTNEEIEKILIQLDKQESPFTKYCFTRKNERLQLLGKGGFALVYEAKSRTDDKSEYAIKVIGFGEKYIDSKSFRNSVKAQKDIGFLQENIVKIYDYTEIFIWLDEDNHVMKIQQSEEEVSDANCLKLQFILMEKLEPVLAWDRLGKAKLTSEELATFQEKEILKFAYDIGTALSRAHDWKMLHRDVKLENVFYARKEKCYKLGDFGIAKETHDGMASTIAFTKGYGAPEVIGSLGEKYDNTADIYSFGMLLYVLLNELKFPDSDYYCVNDKIQYKQGYVLPCPLHGSDELCRMVEKMCRYDPDMRYQSMDEALDDLEKLMFHAETHYQRAHRDTSVAIGALLLFFGTIAWKLTFKPDLAIELSKMAYLFFALSIGKWILKVCKKDIVSISMILLGLGGYLLVASGFSWIKLILLLGITFSEGTFAGLFAEAILTANAVYLITDRGTQLVYGFWEYRWTAVTLLSLAAVMLSQGMILSVRDRTLTAIYLKRNRFWIIVCAMYAVLLLNGLVMQGKTADMCSWLLGERIMEELLTYDLTKVGAIGLGVSIAWIIRERILIMMDERRQDTEKG
ncbi:MAG: protein kinase [Muribaculaceae bacterium]|nr:protein kinase [Muribaculaceae bacterium]